MNDGEKKEMNKKVFFTTLKSVKRIFIIKCLKLKQPSKSPIFKKVKEELLANPLLLLMIGVQQQCFNFKHYGTSLSL